MLTTGWSGGFSRERALHDGELVGEAGIVDEHLHQEPVDLGLRQRVGALRLDRVLCGKDEERLGDAVRLATDRHLVLLHDLEQGRLHLRGRTVDLVGEEEVAEHRAELSVEAVAGAIDTGAHEVGRDEVGRELDAPERPAEDLGERLHGQGLGEAGHALDQDVSAGEQRHEDALEHPLLSDDHALDLEERGFELPAHAREVAGGERRRFGLARGCKRLRLRLGGGCERRRFRLARGCKRLRFGLARRRERRRLGLNRGCRRRRLRLVSGSGCRTVGFGHEVSSSTWTRSSEPERGSRGGKSAGLTAPLTRPQSWLTKCSTLPTGSQHAGG